MRAAVLIAFGAVTIASGPMRAAERITREAVTSDGARRTYYLFVPDSAKEGAAPVIVALHGSGRDGRILVEHWQDVARKAGIILAGPDATRREGWNTTADGPQFLYDVIEAIKSSHSVDSRRVYLFGHSAGAIHGLIMGVLESEYFAAVAVHAGAFITEYAPFAKQAPRKLPIGLWVGTNDRFFPVETVRNTRDALVALGYPARLTEIRGHTHDYYGRSEQINREIWTFLSEYRLEQDPRYQPYATVK